MGATIANARMVAANVLANTMVIMLLSVAIGYVVVPVACLIGR